MPLPTVFLHIGTNKTGTTAIQHFFSQHREELKNAGLLYPTTTCTGEAHYGLSNTLGFFNSKQIKQAVRVDDKNLQRKQLQQEIDNSAAQHILLSSEFFIIRRPVVPVKKFFSDYETKIIIYLRRHDDWWESCYNQSVKTVAQPPWGQGFEAYFHFINKVNPYYSNYRNLVDRWARVFGKRNIIVRPYEKQQNQPDIVSDIVQAMNLEYLVQQIPCVSERSNESLSAFALHFIDMYQRAVIEPDIRFRLIRHAISLPQDETRTSLLSPELRRQLIAENEEDYRYIAKHYLRRADGRLFYAPLPELGTAWQAPPLPSTVEIIEETIKALMEKSEPTGKRLLNKIKKFAGGENGLSK